MKLWSFALRVLLLSLSLSGTVQAQNALPSCKGQDVSQWHPPELHPRVASRSAIADG